MFKDPKTGQKVAFYGIFYIVFAVLVSVGFFAKDYIRPLAALLVPINDKPFGYTFLILTAMYWGFVLVAEFVFAPKKK